MSVWEDEFEPVLPDLRAQALKLANGNLEDAEDILQNGLERIWQNLHQYTPGTNAFQWARKVMKNCFLDERARKRPTVYYTDADLDTLEEVLTTDTYFEPFSEEVREILDNLPEDQAKTLVATAAFGWTNTQVAEWQGVEVGTAHSRRHRGKVAFKDAYGPR